jgi:hypothetical protein
MPRTTLLISSPELPRRFVSVVMLLVSVVVPLVSVVMPTLWHRGL